MNMTYHQIVDSIENKGTANEKINYRYVAEFKSGNSISYYYQDTNNTFANYVFHGWVASDDVIPTTSQIIADSSNPKFVLIHDWDNMGNKVNVDYTNYTSQMYNLIANGNLNFYSVWEAKTAITLDYQGAKNGVDQAMRIRKAIEAKGYPIYLDSTTNQQFVVFEDSKVAELAKYVGFNFIEKVGANHSVVRFATSWATTDEQVDELLSHL
jgi:hypothetical protein